METTEQAQRPVRTVKVPRFLYREAQLEERADTPEGEPRRYALSFSSEAPVLRFDWDTWQEYLEVLGHEEGEIDFSRAKNGLPLLKSHNRLMQAGSVKDIEIDAKRKRLKGMAGFASTEIGQEQETLVREGHLETVSVGYQILGLTLVSKDKNGLGTYRAKWMPMEVSTEPIPADWKVGIGRAGKAEAQRACAENRERALAEADLIEVPIDEPEPEPPSPAAGGGERTMEVTGTVAGSAPAQREEAAPQNAPAAGAPPAPAPSAQVRDRGAEVAEIVEMANAHGCSEEAPAWIRAGLTPGQVGREILKRMRTPGPGQPSAEAVTAMPQRDRRRYSVRRAIAMHVELAEGTRQRIDGLEAEIHQELARNHVPQHGGILVPWRLRSEEELEESRALARRTLGTTEPAGGATLVPGVVMPDMIDLLRNRALILVAGARLYPGLQGNVMFNKKTGDPTVSWMQENPPSAATGSEPAWGYVTMSPKTLIGKIQIPRQLIVQSSIDQEAEARNDLVIGHGLALDRAALHGQGNDKQPVGIYSAAGVLSKSMGGVPDLAKLIDMAAQMADKNADVANQAFMTTPLMAGKLMGTPVVSGQSPMLWTGNFRQGQLAGYTAYATNQVSKTLGAGSNEHGLIHGNWEDLLVGMWGNEIEITVDVVTLADYGQVKVVSYSMADCVPRRPESFVKATGATIS